MPMTKGIVLKTRKNRGSADLVVNAHNARPPRTAPMDGGIPSQVNYAYCENDEADEAENGPKGERYLYRHFLLPTTTYRE